MPPRGGGDASIIVADEATPFITPQNDRYEFVRQLSGSSEILILYVSLADSSGSRLANESLFAETSKSGWNIEGFRVARLVPPTYSSLEVLIAGSSGPSTGVGPINLSGTVDTITDSNNHLALVGLNSAMVGDTFNASYQIGSPVVTSNPVSSSGTAYLANDPIAQSSIDIPASGAGVLNTLDFLDGNHVAFVIHNNQVDDFAPSADRFSVSRPLYNTGGEFIYLNVVLVDATETAVNDENYLVVTSKDGWAIEGFTITRLIPPTYNTIETLMTGSGPLPPPPGVNVSGTIQSISDPNNYLAGLGLTSLSIGQGFTANYQLDSPVQETVGPALAGGTGYGITDSGVAVSVEIVGSGAGNLVSTGFNQDADAGIVIRNDLPGLLSSVEDYYGVARLLPSSNGEILLLHVFLADSSLTQLTDESYLVEQDKTGWNLEGFTISRLLPDFSSIETLVVGGNATINGFPLSLAGTVQSLNDPNDVLTQLGFTSAAIGQNFAASYSLGAAPTINSSSTGGSGDTLYYLSDASANIDAEVFGSGLSTLADSALVGGDVIVGIGNDIATSVSPTTDFYQIIRDLPLAGVTLHIFLLDSTGTRLNDQNFFVEDSTIGWDTRGIAIIDQSNGFQIPLIASNQTTGTTSNTGAGGVKGPTTGATLSLHSFEIVSGEIQLLNQISAGTVTSGSNAQGVLNIPPFNSPPPYVLTVKNGTDISTGASPSITELQTIVTQEMLDSGDQLWASVLTTLGTKMAAARASDPADLLDELPLASAQVLDLVGFGASVEIDIFTMPPVLTPETDTQTGQAQVFAHRLANEIVGQILSDTGNANQELDDLAADIAADNAIDDVSLQTAILDVGTNGVENFMVPDLNNPGSMINLSAAIEGALLGEVSSLQEPGSVDTTYVETQDLFVTTFSAPASVGELTADSDGDGTPDSSDAFPLNPAVTTAGGASEDDDGDGVINSADDAPQNPAIQTDADSDGIDDSVDLDINPDLSVADSDGDGTVDALDHFPADAAESIDSDGDGVGDNADAFPNNPLASADTDADGVGDGSDNCPAVPNNDQTNTDGDAQGDACDDDDDNDGFSDAEEIAAGSDPLSAMSTPVSIINVPIPVWVLFTLAVLTIGVVQAAAKRRSL